MTETEWLAEASRRISISEGVRLSRYADSLGIPTIGVGYNLDRGTGPLHAVGVPDPEAVVAGKIGITQQQALALLANDLVASEANASASLDKGTFDELTDARRFVITDLCYNMGLAGWVSFTGTRDLINMAQKAKDSNNPHAHEYFQAAGDHLKSSAYYTQTGDRAKRNVAMLVQGVWCFATGDGSDIQPPPTQLQKEPT